MTDKLVTVRCMLWAALYGLAHGTVLGVVHPLGFVTRRGRRRQRLYHLMFGLPRLRSFLESKIL